MTEAEMEMAECQVSEEIVVNLQEAEMLLSAIRCSVETLDSYDIQTPEKLTAMEIKLRSVRERLFDQYLVKTKKPFL